MKHTNKLRTGSTSLTDKCTSLLTHPKPAMRNRYAVPTKKSQGSTDADHNHELLPIYQHLHGYISAGDVSKGMGVSPRRLCERRSSQRRPRAPLHGTGER
uniref:Uncharacterized protein n=1 Tax=Arundo donax TaxID=35708 RepID=A0A0A9CGS9_ARUDO